MTLQPLYPLLLNPVLHAKVWGGRRLQVLLGKALPDDAPYGESWELHDSCTVANGPLAGRNLGDLLHDYGAALVGDHNDPAAGFPLLAKFIDASEWLSVQVHPDDAQAAALEGEPRGKTEAWYILDAEPFSKLIIGLQPGADRTSIAQAIEAGVLEDLLIDADVQAGEMLFIPAGTVHALGPGLLIYEIQQSSDTTYRLYDWGRLGLDGKPRPLHIEKALQVANVESLPPITQPLKAAPAAPVVALVEAPYFTMVLHQLKGEHTEAALDTGGQCFHALTCIEGQVTIQSAGVSQGLSKGQTALIPAALGAYTLQGGGAALRCWQTL